MAEHLKLVTAAVVVEALEVTAPVLGTLVAALRHCPRSVWSVGRRTQSLSVEVGPQAVPTYPNVVLMALPHPFYLSPRRAAVVVDMEAITLQIKSVSLVDRVAAAVTTVVPEALGHQAKASLAEPPLV